RSCRPTTRTCDRTRAARLTCYPESAAKHGELARVPDGVLDDTGQEDGKGVVAAGHNLGERVFWEDAQGGFERIAAAGPLREEVVPGYGGLGPFRFRVPGRHRLAGESEAGALIPQQQVLQQRDGGVHAGNRREPGPIGGEIGKDLGKGGAIPATGNGDGVVVGGDALTGGRSRGSHSPTLSRLITCDRVRTLAWGETRGVAPPANIGWAGVGADISHLFFGNPISASIGFEHNPYEFEVGVCDLSLGIVGLMASYYTPAFWLTIIWFASLFKAGCGIGHIRDDLVPKFGPVFGFWVMVRGTADEIEGRKTYAAPHDPETLLSTGRQTGRHQQADRLAHVPSHLFDSAEGERGGRQGGAGAAPTCQHQDHDGHLHASAFARQAGRPAAGDHHDSSRAEGASGT